MSFHDANTFKWYYSANQECEMTAWALQASKASRAERNSHADRPLKFRIDNETRTVMSGAHGVTLSRSQKD